MKVTRGFYFEKGNYNNGTNRIYNGNFDDDIKAYRLCERDGYGELFWD